MALDPQVELQIRLLIPDNEPVYGPDENENLFSSDELEALYEVGYHSVMYTAGLAKITVGSSELLVMKAITHYEDSTRGDAVAKQWLAMGQELLARAEQDEDFAGPQALMDLWDVAYAPEPTEQTEGAISGWQVGFPGSTTPWSF